MTAPPRLGTAAARRSSSASGTSLVEVLIVLSLIVSVSAIGLPALGQSADEKRTRDSAAFLAGQFRMARHRAVLTGRSTAVVFDDVAGEVGWRVCADLDRDGVRRGDIASGVDRCDAAPEPISVRFANVRVAYAPGIPGPDEDGPVAALRFGGAGMAVFSPAGTATSGTIALRAETTAQFAVRVAGVTGRTRILRFDAGRRVWAE